MKLEDIHLGDVVKVDISRAKYSSNSQEKLLKKTADKALVIGLDSKDLNLNVALAWELNDPDRMYETQNSLPVPPSAPGIVYLHPAGELWKKYPHILWVNHDHVVSHTGGMKCKKCQDYNDYASPNQADGSFVCYRCRHP